MTFNQCRICTHFEGFKNDLKVCPAFPNGIPDRVWRASNDAAYNAEHNGVHSDDLPAHNKVLKEQVGQYVFKPITLTKI